MQERLVEIRPRLQQSRLHRARLTLLNMGQHTLSNDRCWRGHLKDFHVEIRRGLAHSKHAGNTTRFMPWMIRRELTHGRIGLLFDEHSFLT